MRAEVDEGDEMQRGYSEQPAKAITRSNHRTQAQAKGD